MHRSEDVYLAVRAQDDQVRAHSYITLSQENTSDDQDELSILRAQLRDAEETVQRVQRRVTTTWAQTAPRCLGCVTTCLSLTHSLSATVWRTSWPNCSSGTTSARGSERRWSSSCSTAGRSFRNWVQRHRWDDKGQSDATTCWTGLPAAPWRCLCACCRSGQ